MILLYGATGYTGKLVVRELLKRKVRFAIGGRNPAKLVELKDKIAKERGKDVPVFVISPDEFDYFKPSEKFSAVLNCAGPFGRIARKIVKFSVENSCHYVDISGESVWAFEVKNEFSERAKEKGIVLSVGCAWETVAGEVCVSNLLSKLRKNKKKPSRVVLVYLADFSMSQGTLRSSFDILRGGAFIWKNGSFSKVKPLERMIEFEEFSRKFLAFNISTADIVNVSHIVEKIFPDCEFEVMFATSFARGKMMRDLLRAFEKLLEIEFFYKLLDFAVSKLYRGPSGGKVRASAIALAFLSDGSLSDKFVLPAKDPYGFTAHILAKAGERIEKGKVKGSGYVPPSQAFGFSLRDFQGFLEGEQKSG